MRILMATTSSAGHFGQLLPFGAALRRAGHEVLVAAPRSFEAAVRRAGYPYWPCDDVAILPGMLAAIDEWRPDVVLRESTEVGSFAAAELRSIPQVEVLVGPVRFTEQTRTVPALSLVPPSLEEGPSTRPVHRFRDVPGEVEPLPAWWPNELDPLVYVTFGTAAGQAFRAVVEALADLPARLLVTVGDEGDPAAWPALPASVHVERWVPQQVVLAHAATMVCHGGMGSVLGALAAGVPLVVVPQLADHPDIAARVAALGAGLSVGVDAVRDAVLRVLFEPSYKEGARRLADEIATLPPTYAAVELLQGIRR